MIPPREAAAAMKSLGKQQRDEAIADATNVIDARSRFEARQHSVNLAHAYRKPMPPPKGGAA